jgi:hypothetical protein
MFSVCAIKTLLYEIKQVFCGVMLLPLAEDPVTRH